MEFEWDENKNRQNQRKHGISFEEAQEIFFGIVFTSIDERYDYDEIREISIGAIQGVVIVTVAHTERNSKIRLISARKATPKEKRKYYEYLAQTT
ncbi:MAG: BrnT family toxin [Moorea sp. SIO3I7]|uniref:BrnT family toxin n=1 Tax=Moorena producens (strain JHB) TaxID=1454205 RepID=A0A1D9G6J5_MOOP1|nr:MULTISPECIES: BrnT family toxin [Moorena]NEN99438.1 BrnT family toxin [Moorena sp. SIO3I7]AOY83203.1 BrnT family toxin [Moorena producens JHB]NEO08045.1 BrnT family toxin [Moorena sp. SIO3I8]NEO22701.1 BrnT family toxin [Moorena sp. SIO4A5]NEP22209.1 BrnT family toxin [Moorena sp. SIO3I6]